MNTKFVLGHPKTKNVGLEHAKNLRRCERWLAEPPPPPPGYEHAHGFNEFFFMVFLRFKKKFLKGFDSGKIR